MSRARDYSLGKVCPCGTLIGNKNATGLCHPCFLVRQLADPDRGRKIAASLSRRLKESPEARAIHRDAARRAGITKRATPGFHEKAARFMREHVQPLTQTPENLAKRDIAYAARKCREAKMAWLPEAYWGQYRVLVDTKKIKAAVARPMILAQVAADKARHEASLSPFERQERALARGAQLIANDRLPSQHDTAGHSPFEVRAA